MIIIELLDDYKKYLQPWLTSKLKEIDQLYWENLVLPNLTTQQIRNVRIYEVKSLIGLDIRGLLRVLEKNWKGYGKLATRNNLSDEGFNYLKETQSLANRFSHIGFKPLSEDIYRAIDTIKRLAQVLNFEDSFIKRCEGELKKINDQLEKNLIEDDDHKNNNQLISLFSLTEIFEKRIIFKIPDYQRGYSWTRKHLDDFWDDIKNLTEDKIHYLGLLTIDKAKLDEETIDKWQDVKWLFKEEPEYLPYYIVDGQQRITTIILFINELINSVNDNEKLLKKPKEYYVKTFLYEHKNSEKGLKFGYETDLNSFDVYKHIIYKSSDRQNKDTNVYTKRLEEARKYIQKKINEELPNNTKKENVLNKIVDCFKFTVYVIADELDESIIFETMNNRGKVLSKLELLKNRLMYLTTLLTEPDEEKIALRKKINDSWNTIYSYLGKNELEDLDDDEFLLNHTYMYFGYESLSSEQMLNSLFNDVLFDKKNSKITIEGKFTSKKVIDGRLTLNSIDSYVTNIMKCVKNWFLIRFPNLQYDDNPDRQIDPDISEYLLKIGRLPFRPFDTILLAVLLQNPHKDTFFKLLKTMERFSFICFYLINRKGSFKKNNYFGKANSIFRNDYRLEDLIGEIEGDTSDCLGKKLVEYKSLIDDLFLSGNGFYDWKGLKYFLYEYETNLQGDGAIEIKWKKAQRIEYLEHIYPDANTNLPCWTEIFNRYRANRKILYNNLGNILLLSKPKHINQCNKCFDYKRSHDGKGYICGSYSEKEVSQVDIWNEFEILNRGIKLLNYMEKRWNIRIGDHSMKQKFLKLDFLKVSDKLDNTSFGEDNDIMDSNTVYDHFSDDEDDYVIDDDDEIE